MLGLAVVVGLGTSLVVAGRASPTTTATSVATPASPRPETIARGWTVAARSSRGVLSEYRNVAVDGVIFRALRLRARTTLLRWHVGSTDPNARLAPRDVASAVDWPSEGRAGVVAVFNGAFKAAAAAGGAVADNVQFWPLVKSHLTLAINAGGHWAMGIWGAPNFPPKNFRAISYRQNLGPLVWRGAVTAAAMSPDTGLWGSPLGNVAAEPRSGLGVDAGGNLIYVATMHHVLPGLLARALLRAGAVTAMELDINPYWPILGASFAPLHAVGGALPVQLPMSEHNPVIYETGWTRDFFVAMAEPPSWGCEWSSRGLLPGRAGAQPQPLALVGRGCHPLVAAPVKSGTSSTTSTTTTTTISTSTTTTSTAPTS